MGHGTLPEVRDGSEDAPGGSGRVGRSFRRYETGGEVLRKVWNGSGDPTRHPGRLGGPYCWFGTGRGTLLEVWKGLGNPWRFRTGWGTLLKVWDGSRDHPIGTGQVGGPSRRSRMGRWTLRGPGRVGGLYRRVRRVERPSRRAGSGWEALPKIQEGLGGLGEVGSLSWRVGRGFHPLPEEWEGLRGPSRGMGGVRRSFGRAEWGQEALPEGREG